MIENIYSPPIYSAMVEEWGQTHFVSSSTFNDSYKMRSLKMNYINI